MIPAMSAVELEPAIIDVQDIVVEYTKGRRALDQLNLRIGAGCHGLLGVNGAGKSTLIKVLLGLIIPQGGSGCVLGESLATADDRLRLRVGYMPESDAHLGDLPAIEAVAMVGELSGLPPTEATRRAHEVLHYCGLGEARLRSADGFSAGMRQRLKLAMALVHDPDLLFLDEPANALDPAGRAHMLDLLKDIRNRGVSLLISTHLLPDVSEICDSVVIVSRGRVVRAGRMDELVHGLSATWRIRVEGEATQFCQILTEQGHSIRVDTSQGQMVVELRGEQGTRPLFEAAHGCRVGIRELVPGARSIEDVFFETIEEPHGDS
jgi:ABC-2 type transport system ATP-binding protein